MGIWLPLTSGNKGYIIGNANVGRRFSMKPEEETVAEEEAAAEEVVAEDQQEEAAEETVADAEEDSFEAVGDEDVTAEDLGDYAPDGTLRNAEGKTAWAPPGSHNAAMAGVQQDAAGHVDSAGSINSDKSGVRI